MRRLSGYVVVLQVPSYPLAAVTILSAWAAGMKIDEALHMAKPVGRTGWFILMCTSYVMIFNAWTHLSFVFLAENTSFRCNDTCVDNSTQPVWYASTSPCDGVDNGSLACSHWIYDITTHGETIISEVSSGGRLMSDQGGLMRLNDRLTPQAPQGLCQLYVRRVVETVTHIKSVRVKRLILWMSFTETHSNFMKFLQYDHILTYCIQIICWWKKDPPATSWQGSSWRTIIRQATDCSSFEIPFKVIYFNRPILEYSTRLML